MIRSNGLGGNVFAHCQVGGVNQCLLNLGSKSVANQTHRIAFAYKENDFAAVKDSGSVITDTVGSVPTGITHIRMGTISANIGPINGFISRFVYYNTRLPDADLLDIAQNGVPVGNSVAALMNTHVL